MIARLLALLEEPRSVGELSARLGAPASAVEGMLKLLESRGYVDRACRDSPACGSCSVKGLCSTAQPLEVWKATRRGSTGA